jgi:hypothetical protein
MARSFLIAALAMIGCAGPPAGAGGAAAKTPREDGGVDVTLTTTDGVKLAATHWAGPGSNERCVILVHQLSSTRDEWGRLLAKLVGRYEIVAIDMRGHGGSTRGPRGVLQWERFGPDDWDAAVADVDAAQRWLGERGFAAADCVLVGASIGGSLVVRHAAAHPPAGLVLLSPGLAYQGLDIADAAARLRAPRLVVYSEEDGAREAVEQLDQLWGGTLEAIQVAGTAHGVALIDEEPAILDLVVRFVDSAGR